MLLVGSLLERTHAVVVAAFSRDELRQFVHMGLGEDFEVITPDANLGVQVFELLLWVNRRNREQELLELLAAARPNDEQLAALVDVVRNGKPFPYPSSAVAGSGRRGIIPLQKPPRTQHFIGRQAELARLLADLQGDKVVTLFGPGGMGKSALAAEAIWTLAPGDEPPARFPDGIIFHTFYHQPQASLALEKIARSYDLDPRPTPRDAALQALAGKKALLVLDGAEQADDLPVVLAVAGSCSVLITTRRHDDAPDEVHDVTPLPRPESLQLLRAWAGNYAAEDAAANDMVRLLGGLPLSLYLCGRYLAQRHHQASEYVAWLKEEGMEALHFGERPSKNIPLLLQRSLEQVNEVAQAAYGVAGILALAPFAAGIVAAALDIKPGAAHRALGELVDYGLLLRPDDSYQITHALAHSYARTKAAPNATNRLALYYAALAKTESAKGPAGYAVLDRQRPHIVAVQAAALEAKQWDVVRRLTWKMMDYLDLKGDATDRITVVQAGLDAAIAGGNRRDEGAFLTALGNAYRDLGETRRAIDLHEQRLKIAREIGDRAGEGSALGNLGLAYADLGETRRAIGLYEQRLVIAREIGDRRGEGTVLGNLGLAYAALGETRRAIDLYEQRLVIAREINDRRGEGKTLGSLGQAYAALDETRRAVDLYAQQLIIVREIGDRRGEGAALGNLGAAYYRLREPRQAIDLYEQQLVIVREIGDRRGEGNALGNLGIAYYSLGEPRRAINLYEQRLAIAREIGDRRGEAMASWNLGLAYVRVGDLVQAIANMQVCVDYEQELGHPAAEAHAQSIEELRARMD